MTLVDKIADILNLDPSKIKVDYNNKTDYEINLSSDDGYLKFLAKVNDGNTMYIRSDRKTDEYHKIFEAYHKIFEAADKSLYDSILTAYEENMAFLKQYDSIIKNDRNVRIYLEEPYFYYNKRSKKLYAIPTITVQTIAALFSFEIYPSQLTKINIVVDKIHENFYQHRFQSFLEKPLNKYSKEELELFHMVKI